MKTSKKEIGKKIMSYLVKTACGFIIVLFLYKCILY